MLDTGQRRFPLGNSGCDVFTSSIEHKRGTTLATIQVSLGKGLLQGRRDPYITSRNTWPPLILKPSKRNYQYC